MRHFIACCAALLTLASAHATDGSVTGTIARVDAVGQAAGAPGNADTRVYLAGISNVCPGALDPAWAYINANDANYKGVLATLLAAWSMGKSVTINSRATALAAGGPLFCQITWINVVG